MLDLFQGAVPRDGFICVATTNNIKTINKLSPALTRPGRLTPIEFGYPNKKIIQEISNHFYNRDLDIELPEELKKPQSQIIEIVTKSKLDPQKGFEYFKKNMQELIGQ